MRYILWSLTTFRNFKIEAHDAIYVLEPLPKDTGNISIHADCVNRIASFACWEELQGCE